MSYAVDALVVGAGVVGLACARRLALAGMETLLVEKDTSFGRGISSRNSEVIHGGLYYAPDSWKARLCGGGREQLYRYCGARHVAHRRAGKWVVATRAEQLAALEALAANAATNGVAGVALLEGGAARRLEPELHCAAALLSPDTGIVDSHGLMTALLGDFEHAGGTACFRTAVGRVAAVAGGLRVVLDDTEATAVRTRWLVNAAGLEAPAVAATVADFPEGQLPLRRYAKGNYFALAGNSPFGRLIYPLPEPGGLGIHLTLDLQGRARFGPDVEWVDAPDYAVNEARRERFAAAVRQYWPACTAERLLPAYAGIRPKLELAGRLADDFVLQGHAEHGVDGLINLFGIESPGLTCCLALADEVARRCGVDAPDISFH